MATATLSHHYTHRQRRQAALRAAGAGRAAAADPRLAGLLVRVAPEHRRRWRSTTTSSCRTCAASRTPTSRTWRRRWATRTPRSPRTSGRSSTSTTSTRCASSRTTSAPCGCSGSRGCTRSGCTSSCCSTRRTPASAGAGSSCRTCCNTWYQLFHQQPWAEDLVGSSTQATRDLPAPLPLGVVGEQEPLDRRRDRGVRRGVLAAGRAARRLQLLSRGAPRRRAAGGRPTVETPTRVLWGDSDSILPFDWSDNLPQFFPNLDAEEDRRRRPLHDARGAGPRERRDPRVHEGRRS